MTSSQNVSSSNEYSIVLAKKEEQIIQLQTQNHQLQNIMNEQGLKHLEETNSMWKRMIDIKEDHAKDREELNTLKSTKPFELKVIQMELRQQMQEEKLKLSQQMNRERDKGDEQIKSAQEELKHVQGDLKSAKEDEKRAQTEAKRAQKEFQCAQEELKHAQEEIIRAQEDLKHTKEKFEEKIKHAEEKAKNAEKEKQHAKESLVEHYVNQLKRKERDHQDELKKQKDIHKLELKNLERVTQQKTINGARAACKQSLFTTIENVEGKKNELEAEAQFYGLPATSVPQMRNAILIAKNNKKTLDKYENEIMQTNADVEEYAIEDID